MGVRRAQKPISDSDIPAAIARDIETTAAVTGHVNATDPHPTYLRQSEADSLYLGKEDTPEDSWNVRSLLFPLDGISWDRMRMGALNGIKDLVSVYASIIAEYAIDISQEAIEKVKAQIFNGGIRNFRADTGTSWSRLISSNFTADSAAFIGSYVNKCGVFAHNFNLGAWKDLWINSISFTEGADVIIGKTLCIGTADKAARLNVGGNANISGFVTLGDNVAIKIKRLIGTASASQGGITSLPHGLNGDKIVGVVVKVSQSGGAGLGSDFDTYGPGYAYDCWHDPVQVNIQNSPLSSQYILGKPISVLIFYIQ